MRVVRMNSFELGSPSKSTVTMRPSLASSSHILRREMFGSLENAWKVVISMAPVALEDAIGIGDAGGVGDAIATMEHGQ